MITHYEILGVRPIASVSEIRSAYVHLIKEAHPDVNPDDDESTERARLIVLAYATLRDRRKRHDYDVWLAHKPEDVDNQAANRPHASRKTHEPKSPWADSPPLSCDNCGNENVVLRRYTFAWVISFIVETRHGHDSFILCNSCRFKKSLLYLLRVMLFGWWALPIGVLYSFVAVFQNLFGGSTRSEENAVILASHGYWLFTKGRFNEALDSFKDSQRLVPGREKVKMIDRLKRLTLPPSPAELFARWFRNLNPAWMTIPTVTAVIYITIHFTSAAAAINHSPSSPRQTPGAPQMSTFDKLKVEDQAISSHINLPRFNSDIDEVSGTINRTAVYVRNELPQIGAGHQGTTQVSEYNFDLTRISVDRMTKFVDAMRAALADATQVSGPAIEAAANTSPNQLSNYLSGQLDYMRSCYYSSVILTIAAENDQDPVTLASAGATDQRIQKLETDSLIDGWIERSGQTEKLNEVRQRIADEERVLAIKMSIDDMQQRIDQESQQIADYQTSMKVAVANSDDAGYNDLVPAYNSLIKLSKSETDGLNAEVKHYNRAATRVNNNSVDDAFDNCLTGNLLLKDFDFVNLTAK